MSMFCISEALEMHDLTLAQEAYRRDNVGIVDELKNIVVGRSRLLLCCNFVRTTGPKNPVFMRVFGIGIFG